MEKIRSKTEKNEVIKCNVGKKKEMKMRKKEK